MKKIIFMLSCLALSFTACRKESVQETSPGNEINGEIITYKLKNGGQVTVRVTKKGEYILGGDIILSKEQIEFLKRNGVGGTEGPTTESTFTDEFQKLWPGGIVYYTINDAGNSSTIQDAIAHWELNTTIDFVQRTNQSNYVDFSGQPEDGAAGDSQLGMVGGRQQIRLVSGATFRTVVHEIGHAVGLLHEHTRADRDTYININSSNITANWADQYATYDALGRPGFQIGPLDFESVMMYPSYSPSPAYPGNTTAQMTKKDGTGFLGGWQLSTGDIAGVNYLYNPGVYVKMDRDLDEDTYIYDTNSVNFQQVNEEYELSVSFYSDAAFTNPITLPYPIKLRVNNGEETQHYQNHNYWNTTYSITIPAGTSAHYIGRSQYSYVMEYGMYNNFRDFNYAVVNGIGYKK